MLWEEVQQLLIAGSLLLDVRTPTEFLQGHLPGAINLPVQQLNEITYPKSIPLMIYCHSGTRSQTAKHFLADRGYQVTDIGAITNYKEHIIT